MPEVQLRTVGVGSVSSRNGSIAANSFAGCSTYGTWPHSSRTTRFAPRALAACLEDASGIGSSRPAITIDGIRTPFRSSMRLKSPRLSHTDCCTLPTTRKGVRSVALAGSEKLPAIGERHRSGIDEDETRWCAQLRVYPLSDRVQESEHCSPRVADDRQRIESELLDHRAEIFDVGLPGDGDARVCPRPSTTTLIVEEQIVFFGQVEHLGQQIAVIGARPTVQNYQLRRARRTVFHPVEGRRGGRRETFLPRRGNRLGHGGREAGSGSGKRDAGRGRGDAECQRAVKSVLAVTARQVSAISSAA